MLENNPRNISARRHGMGLSAARFNRITCEELCRYPYKKIKVRQQLQEKDFQNFGYRCRGIVRSEQRRKHKERKRIRNKRTSC